MTTMQPYPAGTRWNYSSRRATSVTFTEELVLLWEPNGTALSDNYTPGEITPHGLWRMWADKYADNDHGHWPALYASGEVHIAWFVTTPGGVGTFEGAPHAAPIAPDLKYDEGFLTHFTHPVHAETGERLNWLRLPVRDLGWSSQARGKAGFVQEALGWKPSPLQDRMNVRVLAQAAGIHVPA